MLKKPTYDELEQKVRDLERTVQKLKQEKQFTPSNKDLVDSVSRFEDLVANIPGVVYQVKATKDHVYSAEFFNDKITKLFGLEQGPEPSFKDFYKHLPDDEKERFRNSVREAVDRVEPWNYEGRFIRPDGETIWFSGTSVSRVEGEFVIFFGILMDITERKQAEQALSLLNETLEQQVTERTADLQRVNQILMDRSEELAGRTASLEEVNTALKVLLREYGHQQTRLEEKVGININKLTRPHLARLGEGKLTPHQRQLLEAAVGSLDQISSPLNRRFILEGSWLTPTEAQVAGFIRQGKTTKEIAGAMGATIRTVEDHRLNIRKKLRLTKKKINLQAYLQSLS